MFLKYVKYFFILLPIICTSCGSDPVSPGTESFDNFSYPFSNGSYWYYSTVNSIYNFRPDSARNNFSEDTTYGSGISKFIGDTVINSVTYKLFKSQHTGGSHGQNHFHETAEYYRNTDTGLVLYASKNTGVSFGPFRPNRQVSFGPFRPNRQVSFKLGNKAFNSIEEIYSIADFNPDSVIFISPPVNCIRYPVSQNTQWFFKSSPGYYDIYKKYSNTERVITTAGVFNAYKVVKSYYTPSGSLETNFEFSDYLSVKGVVKRVYIIKNIQIYNQQGQFLGYFDSKEEDLLNNYYIP